MRNSRAIFLVLLLLVAAAVAWYFSSHHSAVGQSITVYYTKPDGITEVPWTITMRPPAPGESAPDRLNEAAQYAAMQAVAGPPADVAAVRFPAGTHVLSASVTGSTASVDLSPEVKNQTGGGLSEGAQFKALVYTLTALPGVTEVAVRIGGQKIATLPGGSFEIDEPLRRSDW